MGVGVQGYHLTMIFTINLAVVTSIFKILGYCLGDVGMQCHVITLM